MGGLLLYDENSTQVLLQKDKECQHTTPVAGYVICHRNGN